MKDPSQILADLIATTPGEEGSWFATAKELKMIWRWSWRTGSPVIRKR
jgi:hypothetical protein